MPIPEFIVDIRKKIGHDPLWLPAVTAVVLRDSTDDSIWAAPEVLLVKRADNGKWTPVTGICDPGEEPQDTAAREVKEETGVAARAVALLGVGATEKVTHVNGDQAQYMSIAMRMELFDDAPAFAADDESVEVGWFSVTQIPVENPQFRLMIADAAAQRKNPAVFRPRMGWRKRS